MIKNIIITALIVICLALAAELYTGRVPSALVKEKGHARYKVAIVIDDLGHNTENLESIFSLDRDVTLAVLPNLAYSEYVSNKAAAENCEVILHLPMEPHKEDRSGVVPEPGTICCGMAEAETSSRFINCLASVPGAKGVSNHMGSKATEDRRLMAVIFGDMKKRRLYFLDSFVTAKSVCKDLAKQAGLRYTRRDVFLDNKNDPAYIKGQLLKLSEIAARQGHAVGIGHDRRLTIKTIKETLPELEKKGIELVFVSELFES